jgi:DNA-binding transcriptional ArsR family regulator
MKLNKAVTALDALAQESRLLIFRLLMEQGEAGLSAGSIAEQLHIAPATLSFHLSQLSAARLLESHKEGRSVIYKANVKRVRKLAKFLTARAAVQEEENAPLL